MSTKAIDKENTASSKFASQGKNFAGLKSLNPAVAKELLNAVNQHNAHCTPSKQNTLLTPKVKGLSISKDANTGNSKPVLKRTFGVDLLNTANRNNQPMASKTPKTNKVLHLTNQTPSAKSKPALSSEEIYNEPVEHFIGNKYDNFEDLYDATKIGEILGEIGSQARAKSPLRFEPEMSEQQVKKMTKSLRKMTPSAMPMMAEFELEINLPCILEDDF